MNCTVVITPLIAQKTRLRWISCFLYSYYVTDNVLGVMPFASVNHTAIKLVMFFLSFVPSVLLLHKHISQLRAELGLPRVKRLMFLSELSSPELLLALYSSVLAGRCFDYSANIQITGFVFYDRQVPNQGLSQALAEFLDYGSPAIVFTLGSSAVYSADAGKFYTESVISAQKLGYRPVLLVSSLPQNVPPKPLPMNIITLNYAPYSELFPRAAAIVHQGGMGTTTQALLAGTPMLVVPFSHEQPDNAARIVRLGVGRKLNLQQYHGDHQAIELNKLLTQPQYKVKTLEVRNRIQTENGVRHTCDATEKHLSLNKETQTV